MAQVLVGDLSHRPRDFEEQLPSRDHVSEHRTSGFRLLPAIHEEDRVPKTLRTPPEPRPECPQIQFSDARHQSE